MRPVLSRLHTSVVFALATLTLAACQPPTPGPSAPPEASGVVPGANPASAPTEPQGGRLRELVRITRGGGMERRQSLGWRDLERGQDCVEHSAADGTLRCMPVPAPGTRVLFTDAACAVPVALVEPSPPSQGVPSSHVGTLPGVLGGDRLFDLGAEVARPGGLWARAGLACSPATAPAGTIYAAREVDPGMLVRMEVVTFVEKLGSE